LLGFVFGAHLLGVDARKNVDALTTERVLREGVCFIDDLVASSREHHIEGTARIVDLDGDEGWVRPMELEKAADHLVELGPGACERGWRSAGASRAACSVVGVGCGMNTGQSLPAFGEVQQRAPAQIAARLVARVVEKLARRAIEDDSVILLQIVGSDRCRVVSDGSHPGSSPVAKILYHLCCQRYRGVYEGRGSAEYQHTPQAFWFGIGLVRQRSHQCGYVGRIRKLLLRATSSKASAKSFGRTI